ncbi:MAG: hypothetical protein JOZ49_02385 [Mycolicibacterium sp.]|nr:hypothetical protein [Mycolicibacterium sp.]
MSQLAASNLGILSRSTLANLGKDGRIPRDVTLAKLDDLLSWESGSARGVLFGAAPVPREQPPKAVVPEVDIDAEDDFMNMARHIEERLRELNMSKSRFAAIGGPSRTTLATLGKRGYHPSHDTLERIDTYLMWEPGSAFAALKGGLPIRRGPAPTPHPSVIPLNAIKDRLRAVSARLTRQEQSLAQTRQDIDEMLNHVNLVINDLGVPRRRDGLWSPGTRTASSDDRLTRVVGVADDSAIPGSGKTTSRRCGPRPGRRSHHQLVIWPIRSLTALCVFPAGKESGCARVLIVDVIVGIEPPAGLHP